MSASVRSLVFAAVLATGACASGGGSGAEPPPAPGPEAAPDPTPVTGAEPSADTSGDGGAHYTDAQADRGRDTFRSSCTECHDSREFHDPTFRFKWSRRDLGDLYDLVAETMPEDQPGSLSPQTYADVLAYILRLNDFVAGPVELTPDPERLAAISLAPIRD